MQKTIEEIDEVNEFSKAIQPPTWLEMPFKAPTEERQFYFEQLAQLNDLRVVELRVALTNVFCVMMARHNLWRER